MAFFRVKLCTEHIVFFNSRSKNGIIFGRSKYISLVVALEVVRMNEVKIRIGADPVEQRALTLKVQLAPAHMRNAKVPAWLHKRDAAG